jgi:hypothetical protein
MANTILYISAILWVGETIFVCFYSKPHEVFILLKIVSPTQFYFTFTAAGSNSIFGIHHLSLLSALLRGLQLTNSFRLNIGVIGRGRVVVLLYFYF